MAYYMLIMISICEQIYLELCWLPCYYGALIISYQALSIEDSSMISGTLTDVVS